MGNKEKEKVVKKIRKEWGKGVRTVRCEGAPNPIPICGFFPIPISIDRNSWRQSLRTIWAFGHRHQMSI